MRRKRFIRLVMSYCVHKHEAARMARKVEIYGSYDRLFGHYRFSLAFRPLDDALRKCGSSAEKAEKEFQQFNSTFGNSDDLLSRSNRVVITHYSDFGIEFEEF